jgi:hypothetical protein
MATLRLAALALFIASSVEFAAAPHPVGAQAEEITQEEFDARINAVADQEPAYGPEDGELPHDPEVATVALADLELTDLVATATFSNPYAASRQQFDYGIQFRSASVDDETTYLRLIVVSTGDWAITSGQGDILVSDVYRELKDGRNDENTLTVVVEGASVHAAINGDYVGSVEVDVTGAGDVAPGTAYFGDSFRDGAETGYSDFTVWTLGDAPPDEGNEDGRSNRPNAGVPKPPGSSASDDDPEDESAGDRDEPQEEPAGTRYESPTYGYTLSYDDIWSLEDQSSAEGVDALVLSRDLSTLIVYGLPAVRTAEECRDALIELYTTSVANSGVDATSQNANSGTVDSGNRAGSSYMFVTTTINGSTVGSMSYFECGPVNGGADYLVGVRFSVSDLLFEDQFPNVQALIRTLGNGDTPEDGATDTDQDSGDDVNLTVHVTEGEEGRLVYLSPTFGFTVEILSGWTIEEDSVQGGYDTLVVASSTGRVTVSGFASSGTAVRCVDSIIANLTSDPNLTNVEIGVQPDGSTSRWDTDTTSEVVVFFTADGTNYARYYACFSGNDGQSMLVFAYEALEEDIETEFANIEAMLDLIRVP